MSKCSEMKGLAVKALAATVATLALVFGAPADARDACEGSQVTTIHTADSTYYVDVRSVENGVWTYEETNGLPGLQRGGESEPVPGFEYDDLCIDESGESGSDTLIV